MRSLVLWPSSRCNLKCRYCYAAEVCAEDMEFDTVKKAIRFMEGKAYKLQLAGGEPLLNLSLIARILEYVCRQENCQGISMQTNGVLVDNDAVGLIKKYRIAMGVSLDGSPNTNERQRGGTKGVIEGIECLGRHGISINVNCVVTAYNAGHLCEMVEMAAYLKNIKGIGLDLLRRAGRAGKDDEDRAARPPESSQLIKGLENLYMRAQKINDALPYERQIAIREFTKAKVQLQKQTSCRDYCYAGQGMSYVVLPDGDCYPCGSLAGNEKYRMGNVHSTIRPVRVRYETPVECGNCRYKNICTGCCPSRELLQDGFDRLDCVMKKYIFEKMEKQGGSNETA